ncbi:MAG: hypothetical protein ACOC56_05675, partial [Atribacterota bacterium]
MIGIEKILLRRKNIVLFDSAELSDKPQLSFTSLIATGLQKIENYGYTLSPDLVKKLYCSSRHDIILFFGKLENVIKELLCTDKITEPLFPGFPQQVMEMNAAKLYLYQQFHYAFREDINMVSLLRELE